MEFGWELRRLKPTTRSMACASLNLLVFENDLPSRSRMTSPILENSALYRLVWEYEVGRRSSSIPMMKRAFASSQRARPSRARSGNTRKTDETRI